MDSLLLKYFCGKSGYTLTNLAKQLDMDYTTLYRKMTEASDFTRKEIIQITKLLNLNSEEAQDIFFKE